MIKENNYTCKLINEKLKKIDLIEQYMPDDLDFYYCFSIVLVFEKTSLILRSKTNRNEDYYLSFYINKKYCSEEIKIINSIKSSQIYINKVIKDFFIIKGTFANQVIGLKLIFDSGDCLFIFSGEYYFIDNNMKITIGDEMILLFQEKVFEEYKGKIIGLNLESMMTNPAQK